MPKLKSNERDNSLRSEKLSPEVLVGLINRALPYPAQIHWNKIGPDEIRLSWRGNNFRVSQGMFVEEYDDHFLRGTDLAMLFEELLKGAFIRQLDEEQQESSRSLNLMRT